ncbi:MAG TPA: hypothetical protein VGD58_12430 [Herpetosiphonaceae bacterium]
MFKRLSVLFFLVAATVVVSPPAHAATLTVNAVYCDVYSYPSSTTGLYRCEAFVSGGTGRYVSYTWNVTSNRGNYTVVTTTNTMERSCFAGNLGNHRESLVVMVTVKDSAGATARNSSLTVDCGAPRD